VNLGRAIARALAGPAFVYLDGDLGTGKTTLCRGILRELGHEGAVKSPTFTLVEPYDLDKGQVYHFDLYRLGDPEELDFIGIDDYFSGQHLCLVEWPEKAGRRLPTPDVSIRLEVSRRRRDVTITPATERGQEILTRLQT